MTLAFILARISVAVFVLGAAFLLLPDASTYDTSTLTIPDVIWTPIVGVLSLNRMLPIAELLVCAAVSLAITAAMPALWLTSWLFHWVLGK